MDLVGFSHIVTYWHRLGGSRIDSLSCGDASITFINCTITFSSNTIVKYVVMLPLFCNF